MRQVITERTFGVFRRAEPGVAPGPCRVDGYWDRLVKYVPVETVVVWIAVFGSASAVASESFIFPLFARWALFLGAVATWLWLRYCADVRDWVQLAISTAGFVVWVHAFGVLPFSALPYYSPVAGAVLLPVYTALAPLVDGLPGGAGDSPAA